MALRVSTPGTLAMTFSCLPPTGLLGSGQLSSLLGAILVGCEASRSNSFQNTERDGCPAHMVKAACGGGNVLAHARSGAKEVPELVVAAAISSRGWDALEAEHG